MMQGAQPLLLAILLAAGIPEMGCHALSTLDTLSPAPEAAASIV